MHLRPSYLNETFIIEYLCVFMFVAGLAPQYAKFINPGCHASDYMLHPRVKQLDDRHNHWQ